MKSPTSTLSCHLMLKLFLLSSVFFNKGTQCLDDPLLNHALTALSVPEGDSSLTTLTHSGVQTHTHKVLVQ